MAVNAPDNPIGSLSKLLMMMLKLQKHYCKDFVRLILGRSSHIFSHNSLTGFFAAHLTSHADRAKKL
jgi:hypothetical protein